MKSLLSIITIAVLALVAFSPGFASITPDNALEPVESNIDAAAVLLDEDQLVYHPAERPASAYGLVLREEEAAWITEPVARDATHQINAVAQPPDNFG